MAVRGHAPLQLCAAPLGAACDLGYWFTSPKKGERAGQVLVGPENMFRLQAWISAGEREASAAWAIRGVVWQGHQGAFAVAGHPGAPVGLYQCRPARAFRCPATTPTEPTHPPCLHCSGAAIHINLRALAAVMEPAAIAALRTQAAQLEEKLAAYGAAGQDAMGAPKDDGYAAPLDLADGLDQA